MSKFIDNEFYKEISNLDLKGSDIEHLELPHPYKYIIIYTFSNSIYRIPDEKGALYEFIVAYRRKTRLFPSLRLKGNILAKESQVSFELLKEEDDPLPSTSAAPQSLSDSLKKGEEEGSLKDIGNAGDVYLLDPQHPNGGYWCASHPDIKTIPVYNLLSFLHKEQENYLSLLEHVQAPENISYLEGGIKLIIKIRDFIAAHK